MLKIKINGEAEEKQEIEPVSPTGQYFNSSALSIQILGFLESDIPIDDSLAVSTLEKEFLPVHPRFSSIMVKDKHGVQQWRQVKVNLEDHINRPTFPPNLETYDEQVNNYITSIAMEKLPMNRPLWDVHIIKYKTKKAEGMLVFRLHHALGDGFSIMGAILSCVKRADNPSLPLTFPLTKVKKEKLNAWKILPRGLSLCINTVKDFGWSLLKSTFLEDDRTPLRSGGAGVEFKPIEISTVTYSLDQIRMIKNKLGVTINDVITGMVLYGTQLYLEGAGPCSKGRPHITALVLLNTRMISGYQHLNEMRKSNAKASWGNQFGFLHVSVPTCKDPLSYVTKARQIIKAKRNSLAVYLTGILLETLRKLIGVERTAKYLHSTLNNTTLAISNIIGPIEQMIIADHPVRNAYFMVAGSPQSLAVTVLSYMGKLTVAFGTEKDFVNSQLLISCMEKSFNTIFQAATTGTK